MVVDGLRIATRKSKVKSQKSKVILEKAYYKVQDLKAAMLNLLLISIRSQMATMEVDEIFTARTEINEALVQELDVATEPWGIKITRAELRDFTIGNKINHEALGKSYKNQKISTFG